MAVSGASAAAIRISWQWIPRRDNDPKTYGSWFRLGRSANKSTTEKDVTRGSPSRSWNGARSRSNKSVRSSTDSLEGDWTFWLNGECFDFVFIVFRISFAEYCFYLFQGHEIGFFVLSAETALFPLEFDCTSSISYSFSYSFSSWDFHFNILYLLQLELSQSWLRR